MAPGLSWAKTLTGVISRSTVIAWERPSNITPTLWGFWRIREASNEVSLLEKDEKEQEEGWIRAWRLCMGNRITGVRLHGWLGTADLI